MARGRKPKVKMEDLSQTHAALNPIINIDELTGRNSAYSVNTLEEYKSMLELMTDDEMQEHAINTAGIVPIGVRSILIDRLQDKFVESMTRRYTPVTTPNSMSAKDQEFQRKFFNQ